jgi:hypothetical protein
MARLAAAQHPLACRVLWQGEALMMVGGVVELGHHDGLAFVWARRDLPRMSWRAAWNAIATGLWNAHHRGIRRISAIVAAGHAQGLRLVKRLGFRFAGIETGYAGTSEPMLRYVHCWPSFEQSGLVQHQLDQLERACFVDWCPQMMEAA